MRKIWCLTVFFAMGITSFNAGCSSQSLFIRAQKNYDSGNMAKAVKNYEKILRNTDNPAVAAKCIGRLAEITFNMANYDACIDWADKLITGYPECINAGAVTLIMAEALMDSGRISQSMDVLQNFIAKSADRKEEPRARFLLGTAFHRSGLLAESVSEWLTIADLFPDHDQAPDALYQAARIQLTLNQADDAINTLGKLVLHYPYYWRDSEVRWLLVDAYQSAGRYVEAIGLLERMKKEKGSEPWKIYIEQRMTQIMNLNNTTVQQSNP